MVLPGHFFYSWHPIICKRALVGVVENKPIFRYPWVSGTFPEPRRLCLRGKGQVLERDAAVRGIDADGVGRAEDHLGGGERIDAEIHQRAVAERAEYGAPFYALKMPHAEKGKGKELNI